MSLWGHRVLCRCDCPVRNVVFGYIFPNKYNTSRYWSSSGSRRRAAFPWAVIAVFRFMARLYVSVHASSITETLSTIAASMRLGARTAKNVNLWQNVKNQVPLLCIHVIFEVSRLSECFPTSNPCTGIRPNHVVSMNKIFKQESDILLSSVSPIVTLQIGGPFKFLLAY